MKKRHDGYMVVSDITGYTEYLSESELEHAEDSLRSLLELLIDHNRPPLVISGLEGDAIISYAPLASLLQSQTLVDQIETMYVAFRKALDIMIANTTCPCNACRNLSILDLKFLIHYGTFMIQKLASYDELVGNDVNLLHRLLKNKIVEETGVTAYAAYTEAAVLALRLIEMLADMIPHTESYPHIGAVKVYVQDMDEVWDEKQDAARIVVEPEDAVYAVEFDIPIETTLLWEYLTKPEYRNILWASVSQKLVNKPGGRAGIGAAYRCDHGRMTSFHTILDWQPFNYYTVEVATAFPGASYLLTYYLTPMGSETKFLALGGRAKGPLLFRLLLDIGGRLVASRVYEKGVLALKKRIDEELAEGKVIHTKPIEIPDSEVTNAVEKSLSS